MSNKPKSAYSTFTLLQENAFTVVQLKVFAMLLLFIVLLCWGLFVLYTAYFSGKN